MSLLDDVSIVVTPNGYKAGELYAVVPVPTEGAEEVVNGDFATDSDWEKSSFWTISNGTASMPSTSSYQPLYQNNVTIADKTYVLNFDIISITGIIKASSINNGAASGEITLGEYSTIGNKKVTFITQSGREAIAFARVVGNTSSCTIDNVSVKEYTSADMDVTRATAATRVDEDGLVNYAEIVGSEEITNGDFATDSDWTNEISGWTISNGKANYSGVNPVASFQQNISLSVGKIYKVTYTISNRQQGDFRILLGNTAGTINNSDGTYTEYITYSSGSFFYLQARSSFIGSIDNVSVKEVTRDNVPRIDYTGGGCPHILAEPMRTNLIPYSEDLTNPFYLTTGIVTVTESTTLSPDGTSYGYTITPTSSATNHYFNYDYGQLTVVIGDEVTYSIFVKPNGYNFIQIASSTGFALKFQNFELTGDGVIGTGDISGKTIEKIGDWYRCSVTETASGVNPRFLLSPSETALATRNPVYSNNGTDGVLGWGVQLEVGSYETSYIPNFGTAAGVTRNQDILTRDGIGSLINSTEGVLFVEIAALSDDSDSKRITISDGTLTNRITISIASNIISGFINVNNVTQYTFYESGITTTDFNKIAIKFKENDFAIWINGVEYDVDTSGITFSADTLNTLNFSNATNLSNFFYGKVKQLQVYGTALTDEELTLLTIPPNSTYSTYAEMANALNYTLQ